MSIREHMLRYLVASVELEFAVAHTSAYVSIREHLLRYLIASVELEFAVAQNLLLDVGLFVFVEGSVCVCVCRG